MNIQSDVHQVVVRVLALLKGLVVLPPSPILNPKCLGFVLLQNDALMAPVHQHIELLIEVIANLEKPHIGRFLFEASR
jgi:hypothetical protein